jgi:hypothetical protein
LVPQLVVSASTLPVSVQYLVSLLLTVNFQQLPLPPLHIVLAAQLEVGVVTHSLVRSTLAARMLISVAAVLMKLEHDVSFGLSRVTTNNYTF